VVQLVLTLTNPNPTLTLTLINVVRGRRQGADADIKLAKEHINEYMSGATTSSPLLTPTSTGVSSDELDAQRRTGDEASTNR
jgi:hypothetical protein